MPASSTRNAALKPDFSPPTCYVVACRALDSVSDGDSILGVEEPRLRSIRAAFLPGPDLRRLATAFGEQAGSAGDRKRP